MRQRTVFAIYRCYCRFSRRGFLDGPGARASSALHALSTAGGPSRWRCPRAGQGQATPQAPRNLTITAIPGVVAAGGTWTKIWQQAGNSADGIIPDKDGSVLVAQEDYDTVLRIDENGKTSVAVADAKGIGSISMDRKGRLYGAHRTERPGSTKPDRDSIVNAITLLAPERRVIADKWADGTTLTGATKRSHRRWFGRRVFHCGLPLLCKSEGRYGGRGGFRTTVSSSARTTRLSMSPMAARLSLST